MQTAPQLIQTATATLQHLSNARQEARWLMQQVTQDEQVEASLADKYQAMVRMRANGFPLAYILGSQPFMDFSLQVTPAVLIPRPETEVLVVKALEYIPAETKCLVLDLGTGSGAIALAIARARPAAEIIAVDVSKAALAIARQNINHYKIRNITLLQSDWFAQIEKEQKFTCIVANPPYVAAEDEHLTKDGLMFEPAAALVADQAGAAAIKTITKVAQDYLLPGGALVLEHGATQQVLVQTQLAKAKYKNIHSWQDASGNYRVTCGSS